VKSKQEKDMKFVDSTKSNNLFEFEKIVWIEFDGIGIGEFQFLMTSLN